MTRLLVVDDDPMVKATLRTILERQKHRFVLAGSVANGREALDWLESQTADIVITDLIMPVMTGLELIAGLKEKNYSGSILVLSNYSDFKLVREALLLGAEDYLLKTDLQEDTFLARLGELSEHLEGVADQTQLLEKMDEKFQQSVLREYLEVPYFPEDRFRREAPDLADFLSRPAILCVLTCRASDPRRETLPMERLAGMIETVLEAIPSLVLLRTGHCRLVWLIPREEWEASGKPLKPVLSLIRRQASLYFSLDTVILYSGALTGERTVRDEYRNLRAKSRIRFYGLSGVWEGPEVVLSELPPDWSFKEFAQGLAREYRNGGPEALRDEVVWRLEHGRRETADPEALEAFFARTLDYLGVLEKASPLPLEPCETAEELESLLLREAVRLLSGSAPENLNLRSREIQRVLKYINDNYRNRVSLEELAGEVNLNSSYLCRLFKRETGASVVEYINRLRIRKACLLFDQGSSYIREVAEAVGFDDQLYFARIFRKIMGLSPTEYLKNSR